MFDILVYLVENYFQHGHVPDAETISKRLTAAGFEDHDISEALTWLSAFDEARNVETDTTFDGGQGFRVYAEEELATLTTEARGFLLFLEHSKIISAKQREFIIERVLAFGESGIALEKIKLIVLMVLWNQQQVVDSLVLELLASSDHNVPQ